MTSGTRRLEPPPDRWLLRRLTAPPDTTRARIVRRVVPWADDLKPWLLLTPLLVCRGQRGRRAAASGWTAVLLATAIAKPIKAGVDRARPDRPTLASRVVAGDEPSTPSFPSTHTSSAVAFAGAVSAAWPPATWVTAPLALFVAFSRPAGGRHYPSDIAGGVLIGAVAAASVTLGRRPLADRLRRC